MRSLLRLTVLGIAICLFNSNSFGAIALEHQPGALLQIENEFKSGQLSLDEKVLLEVAVIKKPETVSSKYQPLTSFKVGNGREATLVLKEIIDSWELLLPETQQAVSLALTRHAAAFTHDSPGGFFKLHYDTTGTHAVPSADTNSNFIPDFIERMAAYCDSSLTRHTELNYITPPPDNGLGGDNKYDVYFENMGFYGYAVPENNGSYPWNDRYSHVVLHRNFTVFPPNDDPEGDILGAAKVTIAHEYHHAVQFAYDVSEPGWFMELDATYMEDIVFDLTDDNYNYLGDFMVSPQTALSENSGHAYSSFIWGLYLAQKFDTSLMTAAWEGARYNGIFSTFNDTLQARYGWTQDSALADFVTWNFATGSRNDNLHHEEAGSYPLINIGQSFAIYPVTLRNSPSNPAGYGSNYVQFFPGAAEGNLTVMFDGANNRDWAAYVIKSTSINNHEFIKFRLDSTTKSDTLQIEGFENYYSVTLVGVNISEFSSGSLFSYWARVVEPHGVSTIVTPTDSVIYSGNSRDYEFKVTNPLDDFDIYTIEYWDDSGWIAPDSITRSIAPFAESTFVVAVQPPQGTPLGNTSELHFKATSVDDPFTTEETIKPVTTVLFKGDANFDGNLSLLDLNYYVNYIFRSGPPPIPVLQSGDFNCDGFSNLLDLNELVNFVFRGGPKPTCNPY